MTLENAERQAYELKRLWRGLATKAYKQRTQLGDAFAQYCGTKAGDYAHLEMRYRVIREMMNAKRK